MIFHGDFVYKENFLYEFVLSDMVTGWHFFPGKRENLTRISTFTNNFKKFQNLLLPPHLPYNIDAKHKNICIFLKSLLLLFLHHQTWAFFFINKNLKGSPSFDGCFQKMTEKPFLPKVFFDLFLILSSILMAHEANQTHHNSKLSKADAPSSLI